MSDLSRRARQAAAQAQTLQVQAVSPTPTVASAELDRSLHILRTEAAAIAGFHSYFQNEWSDPSLSQKQHERAKSGLVLAELARDVVQAVDGWQEGAIAAKAAENSGDFAALSGPQHQLSGASHRLGDAARRIRRLEAGPFDEVNLSLNGRSVPVGEAAKQFGAKLVAVSERAQAEFQHFNQDTFVPALEVARRGWVQDAFERLEGCLREYAGAEGEGKDRALRAIQHETARLDQTLGQTTESLAQQLKRPGPVTNPTVIFGTDADQVLARAQEVADQAWLELNQTPELEVQEGAGV